MKKSCDIKFNLEKMIKEILPEDVKITEKAIDTLSNICIDLIKKVSVESGPDSNFSKNQLTKEEILKIISKAGLNKYLVDLDEELKRLKQEELKLNNLSK